MLIILAILTDMQIVSVNKINYGIKNTVPSVCLLYTAGWTAGRVSCLL